MNDAYYAPTCGFYTFECKKCGKENFVDYKFSFMVKKIEDVKETDLEDAFFRETNVVWDKEDEKKIRENRRKDFKRMRKRNGLEKNR